MRTVPLGLAVFVSFVLFLTTRVSIAAGTDLTLTIAARPRTITGYGPVSLTGHAYIVLGVRTNTGIKEDVFGFYPKEEGKGAIKGPGMLTAEYRCLPSDECSDPTLASKLRSRGAGFADVTITETIAITDAQRRDILTTIKSWNGRGFDLVDSSCVHFVADVVAAAGYPVPSVTGMNRSPVEFVEELKRSIAVENQLRNARERAAEAEARRREAEQERDRERDRAAEAERRTAEAERRAVEAEERWRVAEEDARRRRAETPPAGWVQCQCPDLHKAYGRDFNGTLWHANNLNCQ